MLYVGYKGDKTAARPPGGSLVEIKSAILPFAELRSGPKSRTGSRMYSGKNVPIFILRHTSVRMWHKAILRWVLSQGRSPTRQAVPKIVGPRQHSSFRGALGVGR